MAVLDEARVRSMRAIHSAGFGSVRELGEMFGVSGAVARAVITRRNWKHVSP
jgi:hypothetical protein